MAAEAGLSKSGVIGHFGSKEQLQLATVEAAIRRFRDEVWAPVSEQPGGLARLRALMASWLSYLEREVFPGGCFLTAAAIEFDDRPGPVRDAVAAAWRVWLDVIEREVATAQTRGQLAALDASPRQLAFELHAYVTAGNSAKQLFRDPAALEASRVAIDRLLTHVTRARAHERVPALLSEESSNMPDWTKKNFDDLEDRSPADVPMQWRFARDVLHSRDIGVSRFEYEPGARMPWGHRHGEQEEVYVVVAGTGRAKLDDEIVELATWDVVRVAPAVARSFEAGPEGMDVICIGSRRPEGGDNEKVPDFWD